MFVMVMALALCMAMIVIVVVVMVMSVGVFVIVLMGMFMMVIVVMPMRMSMAFPPCSGHEDSHSPFFTSASASSAHNSSFLFDYYTTSRAFTRNSFPLSIAFRLLLQLGQAS
jgi:hypothetical protein